MNACFLFTSCMNTWSYRGVENWQLQLQPNTLTFDLFATWNLWSKINRLNILHSGKLRRVNLKSDIRSDFSRSTAELSTNCPRHLSLSGHSVAPARPPQPRSIFERRQQDDSSEPRSVLRACAPHANPRCVEGGRREVGKRINEGLLSWRGDGERRGLQTAHRSAALPAAAVAR